MAPNFAGVLSRWGRMAIAGFLAGMALPGLSAAARPPNSPARAISTPTGKYPDSLINSLARGFASVYVSLDENGRTTGLRVLRVTHPDFVAPALDALATWIYEPALSNGRPVPSAGVQNIWFDVRKSASSTSIGSYAFGLKAVAPRKVPKEYRYDREPDVLTVVNPVYPYELALAGTTGRARVDLTVNRHGVVDEVTIVEATHPEFGKALQAMAYACLINPATKQGRPLPRSFLWREQRFEPGANHLSFDAQTEQILRELRTGAQRIVPAEMLAAPLRARYQPAPVYPLALQAKGVAGVAEVEFIVDHRGRAQLPRAITTSGDEFGWAAVTAVQQWLFEPVQRDGAPVWVRVRTSVEFRPVAARAGAR